MLHPLARSIIMPKAVVQVILLFSFISAAAAAAALIPSLTKEIRQAYHQSGTIGVLKWSQDNTGQNDAPSLVQAALEASRGDKGKASGILNAMIGSCCCRQVDDRQTSAAAAAIQLMASYDDLAAVTLQPNLVALSLAYTATRKTHETDANRFLERAVALNNNNATATTVVDENPKSTWDSLKRNHDIDLLQETSDFVVISKPSGMVCFHNEGRKTINDNDDMSLEECLSAHGVPLSTLNTQGRGLVHRIDRGTSGCMVIAKTNEMHALLMSEFFLRNVNKTYQALVDTYEQTTLPASGSINLPIAGRPAESHYIVLKNEKSMPSLLQVTTRQGRKHQVRLHCSRGLKTPIVLDPRYGGERIMFQSSSAAIHAHHAKKRFCLHAASLVIPNFDIHVQTPIPEWWEDLF